jgi:hypothetical protein
MAVRHTRDDLATPDGLLTALQRLFPAFGDDELVAVVQSGEANLHTVVIEFSSSFDASASTQSQLTGLASLMSLCVAAKDELENAVGTCFLEHLRQLDRRRILWKYLSPDVRSYVQTQ